MSTRPAGVRRGVPLGRPDMARRSRTSRRWLALLLGGAIIVWALATAKVTTRQGINYDMTTRQIPLYVKAVDFLHRHYHYHLTAEEITRGLSSDRERVLAVFDWTRQQIRPTPSDVPIVDDHILHIMIRGYGVEDQMADVFATLSTYAGVPAFWTTSKNPQGRRGPVFSFARVEGRWRVFDVMRGFVFRNAAGELATPEELARDPQLVSAVAANTDVSTTSYVDFVGGLSTFQVPRTLRADLQKPWPRLWYEARRALEWRLRS